MWFSMKVSCTLKLSQLLYQKSPLLSHKIIVHFVIIFILMIFIIAFAFKLEFRYFISYWKLIILKTFNVNLSIFWTIYCCQFFSCFSNSCLTTSLNASSKETWRGWTWLLQPLTSSVCHAWCTSATKFF